MQPKLASHFQRKELNKKFHNMSFSNLEWVGGVLRISSQPCFLLSLCIFYALLQKVRIFSLKITPLTANFKLQLWVSFCLKPVYFGHPCAITHIPRVGASWLGCMGNESMENMRKWSEVLFTYGKCKRSTVVANM